MNAKSPEALARKGAYNRAYQAAHADALNARQRAHHAEHADAINARHRAHHAEHADAISARKRVYRAEHADAISAVKRVYYAERADAINARSRADRDALTDGYVRKVLFEMQSRAGLLIPGWTPPPELIEAKRLHLMLNRLIKEKLK